jgi:hypothetical protein
MAKWLKYEMAETGRPLADFRGALLRLLGTDDRRRDRLNGYKFDALQMEHLGHLKQFSETMLRIMPRLGRSHLETAPPRPFLRGTSSQADAADAFVP